MTQADPADKWQKALLRDPDDAVAHYNLALALARQGKTTEAAAHYEHAIASEPAHAQAHNNLGNIQAAQGRTEEAITHFRQALTAKADYAEAANNLGNALAEYGQIDEAQQIFARAIALRPEFPEAHFNLSVIKKYAPDDPDLKTLESMARAAPRFSLEEQIHLWFALGKAREDVGRYDDAFAAYETGNRLKRSTFEHDEKRMREAVDDIQRRYDKKFARAQTGWRWGYGKAAPVFIVGMPRSGTTLVEQILASHSQIAVAGERPYLPEIVSAALGVPPGAAYLDRLALLGKKELRAMGQAYARKLRVHGPAAAHITDKLPSNYLYAGLITKILPKARIIHVVRDPLDTCFSNYALLFRSKVPFAYDLAELGHQYRLYERLMNHWKEVLPREHLLEIRYEDLVTDLEGETRKMIKFCGLGWQASCLEFHRTERPVNTASLSQVRSPLYNTSVSRAARFSKHLQPLIAALDGETPA
ncbi:MAG TPA: sulfotransferase [Patescibacteria group bacterium]|nr:sulfotransferase [Patescibacteria group bacterium]